MSSRTVVLPAQIDFDTVGRRDYWVAFEHDKTWAEYHLPLTVIVGPNATPDKGLLATGANHGNEYEGPVALKHLLAELRTEDVAGRVMLIPVLNPAAFRAGARDSIHDDGVNMNRAFVDGAGTATGLTGITHRIARFVREHLLPRVHVVLDLHAGGQVARFAPCTSFHPIDEPEQAKQIELTARDFGTPFVVIYQNQTPGLLPSLAERLGKITIGTELGWGESINHQGVIHARRGVLSAGVRHGQLSPRVAVPSSPYQGTQRLVSMIRRECFSVAPHPGHFEPALECGGPVTRGQTIGWIHDFHRIDEPATPITAQVDGFLLVHAWGARVVQGQWIAVVAEPCQE